MSTQTPKPGSGVTLWQGGSFAGQMYGMSIDGTGYPLSGPNLGGPTAEEEARKRAREILTELYPNVDINLDRLKFRWNGTL